VSSSARSSSSSRYHEVNKKEVSRRRITRLKEFNVSEIQPYLFRNCTETFIRGHRLVEKSRRVLDGDQLLLRQGKFPELRPPHTIEGFETDSSLGRWMTRIQATPSVHPRASEKDTEKKEAPCSGKGLMRLGDDIKTQHTHDQRTHKTHHKLEHVRCGVGILRNTGRAHLQPGPGRTHSAPKF